MWIAALTLLRNNWKLLAVIVAIAAIFFYGYHIGYGSAESKCIEERLEAAKSMLAAVSKAQAAANQKSTEYQADAAIARKQLATAQRRLQDEKAKNTAYATCHVTDGFVQLYEDTRLGRLQADSASGPDAIVR